jgi:hypothetical protein
MDSQDRLTELGKVERIDNGFELVRFVDASEHECSLQQSSLAEFEEPGTSAVRLGVGVGPNRMHLRREQVESLVSALQNWLDTGSFGEG